MTPSTVTTEQMIAFLSSRIAHLRKMDAHEDMGIMTTIRLDDIAMLQAIKARLEGEDGMVLPETPAEYYLVSLSDGYEATYAYSGPIINRKTYITGKGNNPRSACLAALEKIK